MGGLHGLLKTWQVSFLHREPCCLVGDKNLNWGQYLSQQVGGSPCAPAGCIRVVPTVPAFLLGTWSLGRR